MSSDSVRSLFARRGLRCTAQRTALYEALCATTDHPTAEALYQQVKPKTSSLSLATVYSTLETFCRVGLAQKLPTTDGGCRFDASTHDHVHLRLVDGAIRDVPEHLSRRLLDAVPEAVVDAIQENLGVEIDGLNIQLIVRGD